MIRVIPADESHVLPLIKNLRTIDQAEIYYTTGSTDYQDTIIEGIQSPDSVSYSIFADHMILCICGLIHRDDYDIVWALGTNEIKNHKLSFYRETKRLLMSHRGKNPLVNCVYEGNLEAIAYLRRLGFTIEDAAPYGTIGKRFHHFHMRGSSDVYKQL